MGWRNEIWKANSYRRKFQFSLRNWFWKSKSKNIFLLNVNKLWKKGLGELYEEEYKNDVLNLPKDKK